MDITTRTELEAAAFRALLAHLDKRSDVQNIDMMNLTGFCRNCLSRWYMEAAQERGIDMDKDAAREALRHAVCGLESQDQEPMRNTSQNTG